MSISFFSYPKIYAGLQSECVPVSNNNVNSGGLLAVMVVFFVVVLNKTVTAVIIPVKFSNVV